jgi:hypothetical protein
MVVDHHGAPPHDSRVRDRVFAFSEQNFPSSEHRSIYLDNHAPRIPRLLETQANWVDAIQAFTERMRSLSSD